MATKASSKISTPKGESKIRLRTEPNGGPRAERPSFNKGYGIGTGPDGMRDWKSVTAQLEKAKNYWLGTVPPDGSPHVMPVWGVWMNGAMYCGTDRESRKGRNLQKNPAVMVHLESGDEVEIVEGRAVHVTDSAEIGELDSQYAKKYGMTLTGASPVEPFVEAVEPKVIFAWRDKDFPKSATRWRFGGGDGRTAGPEAGSGRTESESRAKNAVRNAASE